MSYSGPNQGTWLQWMFSELIKNRQGSLLPFAVLRPERIRSRLVAAGQIYFKEDKALKIQSTSKSYGAQTITFPPPLPPAHPKANRTVLHLVLLFLSWTKCTFLTWKHHLSPNKKSRGPKHKTSSPFVRKVAKKYRERYSVSSARMISKHDSIVPANTLCLSFSYPKMNLSTTFLWRISKLMNNRK